LAVGYWLLADREQPTRWFENCQRKLIGLQERRDESVSRILVDFSDVTCEVAKGHDELTGR
jgi:hypothetical protein